MLSSNINHSTPISMAGLEETLLKKVSLVMYVLFHEKLIQGLSNCILIREYGVIKFYFIFCKLAKQTFYQIGLC